MVCSTIRGILPDVISCISHFVCLYNFNYTNRPLRGPGIIGIYANLKVSMWRICQALRTFAPIATAHPYSGHKFTCHVMHRARALRTKMNNDRGDGHC